MYLFLSQQGYICFFYNSQTLYSTTNFLVLNPVSVCKCTKYKPVASWLASNSKF